jgi:4'-phosphopantetheinyl transferase EntD
MVAVAVNANSALLSPQIAALFPAGVAAAELSAPGDPRLLAETERLSVARAVPTRLIEFAAGRHCAHRALTQLGADAPLAAGEDRAPQWPAGLTGSITHTGGFAAAVAARTTDCRALGLDAQAVTEVGPSLWPEFCTAAELRRLEAVTEAQRSWAATLCFAAKEAFYKCQYTLSRAWLDFDAVEIDCDESLGESGTLRVRAVRPSPALAALPMLWGGGWSGRFSRRADLLVVGIAYSG